MKTVLFAGVVFALATSTFAQDQRTTPSVSSSGSEDIEFVLDAAKGGMAEVELGKLAAERATNDEVKKFAQRMVDDHTKAGDELKSIAERKGIRLPQEIETKDRALFNRLQKLNGAAFDRAYMQAMVSDHVKDVSEFKHESNAGRDPQVKAFAASTLPTLEEHLQHARQARKTATTTAANSGLGIGIRDRKSLIPNH
jgi:putative membrane protein